MSKVYDRRMFLKLVGAAGWVPLIGTSTASALSQPTHASSVKGSAKSVVIPTHEWCGELDERLDFPGDWEIEVLNMKGYKTPVLTPQQIGQATGAAHRDPAAAGDCRRQETGGHHLRRPDPSHANLHGHALGDGGAASRRGAR